MAATARILVIDDDDDLRETLAEFLTLEGYRVTAASNGRVGLALLREQGADLVITDLFMPEQEGIETILEVRRTRPEIPIVAMSGGGVLQDLHLLAAARYHGAVRSLPKPLDLYQMADVVRSLL